ncbi:MAG TPA: hypothetical protein VK081_00865, partial [Planctomycetota bacterium]|nr:hypothetical protein [Planctomycetota bacterium]
AVELVVGHRKGEVDLHRGNCVALAPVGAPDGTLQTYEGTHRIERSGPYAYGLRVRAGDQVLWA